MSYDFRYLLDTEEELVSVDDSIVHFMTENLTSLRFMDVKGWRLDYKALREFIGASLNLVAVRSNGYLLIKSGMATTTDVADFFQYKVYGGCSNKTFEVEVC